jgi:hypothetical protein
VLITVAVAIKKKNRSKTGDKPNKPKKK